MHLLQLFDLTQMMGQAANVFSKSYINLADTGLQFGKWKYPLHVCFIWWGVINVSHQIQSKLHNSVLEYAQEGQRIK